MFGEFHARRKEQKANITTIKKKLNTKLIQLILIM